MSGIRILPGSVPHKSPSFSNEGCAVIPYIASVSSDFEHSFPTHEFANAIDTASILMGQLSIFQIYFFNFDLKSSIDQTRFPRTRNRTKTFSFSSPKRKREASHNKIVFPFVFTKERKSLYISFAEKNTPRQEENYQRSHFYIYLQIARRGASVDTKSNASSELRSRSLIGPSRWPALGDVTVPYPPYK
jgi:hypothetical protein